MKQSKKFSPEVRERAVRLVFESRAGQLELIRVVERNEKVIRKAWNEHFGKSDDGTV